MIASFFTVSIPDAGSKVQPCCAASTNEPNFEVANEGAQENQSFGKSLKNIKEKLNMSIEPPSGLRSIKLRSIRNTQHKGSPVHQYAKKTVCVSL